MTHSAKVMLLGAIGVGKTSLANRFVFDRFDTDYKTTIGVNILTHDVVLPEEFPAETLRLVLWDTDGDFGQTLFTTTYILGAAGAIVVADATRALTVEHMFRLADAFVEKMPGRALTCVVNKCDLAADGLDKLLNGSRHAILRTSARTGDGVANLFQSVGIAIRRRGF